MIEIGRYDNGFIWNPSICEYECNKSCDVRKYSDYESYKSRKRLIYKLVEEFSEDTDGNEIFGKVALNGYRKVCRFCIIHIVLLVNAFSIIISISSVFFLIFTGTK